MTLSQSSRKQTCNLSRREACKKIPCATVGALAAAGLMANATAVAAGESPAGKSASMEDNAVPHIVTVKVMSQEGTCGLGHKVGDTISFSENGVNGPICIHALYAILPKIFAMMYDARFPWLEDPDVSTSACPDAANPVVFEISRKKAD